MLGLTHCTKRLDYV